MTIWRQWPKRRSEFTCRELVELVTEYLEGALSERDHRRFERHIAACPHCTAYLEQLRMAVGILGTLSERDIPDKAREELLQAFRDWKLQRA
jgi:anti-sigma factor RsiW